MATPVPSMSATDGALAMIPMVDFDTQLSDPVWDPVGLCSDWRVDPAKQHQLVYYGGLRRLANDVKTGEAYSMTFSIDVEAVGLDLYDRVTKDINGTGTAEEYLAFAVRIKYDNVDYYVLSQGVLISEVSFTIARDILRMTFTCVILKSLQILNLADFKTETQVVADPQFNAPPAPDPFTHFSVGTGVVPVTVNTVAKGVISMTITHTNGVQPIVCLNDTIASGGAIGHQSVRLTMTVYENTPEYFAHMVADDKLDIEIKLTADKKVVMNDFKINGHPLAHPQTSEDLGTIGLTLDGAAAILTTFP